MGRNSMKRKKERTVLFPEFEQMEKVSPREVMMGMLIKIGRPSNRYFQYIYRSLDFFNLKLSDLKHLIPLQGTKAKVIGLIQMVNGDEIAIIAKRDGTPFFSHYKRLFVDRKLALEKEEITIAD
ncbi:hypothetical protein [Croceitalea rosinachiae]|uniref:Uncharacterized protein n=1 Tax=Croceitalea rosinachiae TaxID=3075596 RepID=A0ABU3A9R9_9FLAO|nr:hypothetical protein [Croceitalea sp. F388]MDT0606633.1 hypothetical protein [Croceitalea sp. F388]